MFYYTYVLHSKKDGLFYMGYTNNLKRRLYQHNNGENISTRNRRPLKLIYFEGHLDKKDALRREKYLKTNKGKTMLRYIIKEYLTSIRSRL
jgi:putative endonuclease